jgi:hypothetical protein
MDKMNIDTSDKIDHDQMQMQRVWALVDVIEHRLNLMAHEIPELKDKLQDYQDQKLRRIYFINYLAKFIDNLNA